MTKIRVLPLVVVIAGLLGVLAPSTAAAPVSITHSQSLVLNSSLNVNCSAMFVDTSYLRVFDLPDFGIDGQFTVSSVDVGVGQVQTSTGPMDLEVNLYTLSGAFVFANLTPIGSSTFSVSSGTNNTLVNVPVEGVAPPGSMLVVEIFAPDSQVAGIGFAMGANDQGETGPSYLAAPACGIDEPTPVSVIIPIPTLQFHFVMEVHGDALPPPIDLCVNIYTRALSEPRGGAGCPRSTRVITMPVSDPTTICINAYTGALTWSPSGNCGALSIPHIVPDDGPLPYCRSQWTGQLRALATGQCRAHESPGVIPGDETSTPSPR